MVRTDGAGHAAVAVRLDPTPGIPPLGCDSCPSKGVYRVNDAEMLLADPDVVLIDVTVGRSGLHNRSLDAAVETMRPQLTTHGTTVHLVNVMQRHLLGDAPLTFRPSLQGALLSRLAPDTSRRVEFPSRADLRERLGRSEGAIVIRGRSGIGKSSLAREAAVLAGNGYGWFLSGATKTAFEASLAQQELEERNEPLSAMDAEQQRTLAGEARRRLADSEGSWVVVIDNADSGPEELKPVPSPGRGQLLIFTSTAPAAEWAGFEVIELDPLPDSDLELAAQKLGIDTRLVPAFDGTPLLLRAFLSLTEEFPEVLRTTSDHDFPDMGEGADPYWILAKRVLSDQSVAVAETAALLPPDRVDEGLFSDGERARLPDLVRAGLLEHRSTRILAMHRILGEAVRSSADPTQLRRTTEKLLGSDLVVQNLLQFADSQVLGTLVDSLGDSASGNALWGLGTIQEMHDGSASTATFRAAADHLNPSEPLEAARLADALHAQARSVNQQKNPSQEAVTGAIAQVTRAISIRPRGDAVGIAKHEALQALLRQRVAKVLPRGSGERLIELNEICEILDDSYGKRLEGLGPTHSLVDRALFNRAGIRILLAQEDEQNRRIYLDEAERVYRETSKFRRAFYLSPSPLTAASVAGLATWGYYSVLYGLADEPTSVISEAIEAACESLELRRELGNKTDIGKSAALLSKLGLVQVREANASVLDVLTECIDEFDMNGEPKGFIAQHSP